MDLSGRPLLDTDVDRALFAGRESEFERLLTAVEGRRNTLVIGERGAGKTTLLRQCALELRRRHPDSPPPVFVEGGLAADVRTFLELVRYRAGLPPEGGGRQFESLARNGRLDDTLELPRLVASLAEASAGGDRIVLVDDLPANPIGETLFGRLRDELWQLPLTWVVAVTPAEAGSYLRPPADAFFDARVELGPLSEEQRRRLLAARAGPPGAALAETLDEGNPRRLLALARGALQEGRSAADIAAARVEHSERLSRVGEPARTLLQELESLGPASASDQELLRRLGWTRPRAVQVFGELEREGLVTSSLVKGTAGRPRKVYRPAPEGPR
jgi:hypothetical protein